MCKFDFQAHQGIPVKELRIGCVKLFAGHKSGFGRTCHQRSGDGRACTRRSDVLG